MLDGWSIVECRGKHATDLHANMVDSGRLVEYSLN